MGGTTMHHYGDNEVEALKGLIKEIEGANERGLWLDSPILVLQQFKKSDGQFVIIGKSDCMVQTVFNHYIKKDGKWKKPYCAICHVHC